ncbi:MAG TPA: type II secretion system secretin GspD [Arenimonas sp.]|nr:type II secretion system secretin GspD [Arenimonas sp.]
MNQVRHSRLATAMAAAGVVLLGGCASTSGPVIQRGADALATTPVISRTADAEAVAASKDAADSRLRPGSGVLIDEKAAAAPAPDLSSAGEATFNFEGDSLHAVVKAILGDLLQQNYVIAPSVQGSVTLATPKPVNGAQALSLLEMVLGWSNARLVWSDGRYNVVPADQAIAGLLAPRSVDAKGKEPARGYEVRAIPLRFISASEMEKLIKPYARPNAVVSVDAARNLIVLGGSRSELLNYLRTVEIFDVDWLAGMSVGVFPLQSAEATKVAAELEKLFGESGNTPLAGMFRFMPLEGQNAILAITHQPKYLSDLEEWIERIDAGGEGARLYTYEANYMKAVDLAEQLSSVFGGSNQTPGGAAGEVGLMPGLQPVEVRTVDTPAADAGKASARAQFQAAGGARGGDGIAIGDTSNVAFSAVEERNALLVRASPQQWDSIRRTIEKLDMMPQQVHVEAQIVEVKLVGQLEYGVSWFFGNSIAEGVNRDLSQTLDRWRNPASSLDSGSGNFTFVGPSAQAIVSTLDNLSDVRVMASPSLLVRNNVEANFSAGQQIPVASTIIDRGGTDPNVGLGNYSQVQFRQTGISLKVTPRVSRDGLVFMDIEQEVSTPSADGPEIGGNISVDNNNLSTEVAVRSGETIMLAGLIRTEQGRGSNGIPFLSRLPAVGALFGKQNRRDNRSEVLILITPTLVRDPEAARKLTDEYGQRFRALEPLRKAEAEAGESRQP